MGRAGSLKTNLTGDAAYKSFVPAPLPPDPPLAVDQEMLDILVKAQRQLALLDGLSERIPNVSLFISMYVRKEALMSSQIEGMQATLEDILDPMVDENANLDVADVINYAKATEYAIRRLKEIPLCNRLIGEIHAVLMEGVRGQEKNPGEFRRSQNWIGGHGSTLRNARFIPPSPDDMADAMADLEKYINADNSLDNLIRAALIHYQFETIHPFLDGNGRVGRLLVTLFLMDKGVLTTPALYVSYYLKKNRIEYYDRMTDIRNKGSYEQWVKFFLQAIHESAEDAVRSIDRLTKLHDKNEAVLAVSMGRSYKTAIRLFAYLEEHPIIDIKKTATALKTTFSTISRAVERFVDAGILVQTAGVQRGRVFAYREYLEILREGT